MYINKVHLIQEFITRNDYFLWLESWCDLVPYQNQKQSIFNSDDECVYFETTKCTKFTIATNKTIDDFITKFNEKGEMWYDYKNVNVYSFTDGFGFDWLVQAFAKKLQVKQRMVKGAFRNYFMKYKYNSYVEVHNTEHPELSFSLGHCKQFVFSHVLNEIESRVKQSNSSKKNVKG